MSIFVMACNNLLILYGGTYLSRLWCIWELYAFFATSVDPNTVQLRPLGSLSLADTKRELMTFDVLSMLRVTSQKTRPSYALLWTACIGKSGGQEVPSHLPLQAPVR